jgi:predicted TIM-barrel fold metal-dependent hydrolase
VLERADQVFYDLGEVLPATKPPREIFEQHMYVCILRDNLALASLDQIPIDNMMWESDYPHESGTFPNSRALLDESMINVPDAVAVKIAETNARRLFQLA